MNEVAPPITPKRFELDVQMLKFGENSKADESLCVLKDLFKKQLPNMPLEYVSRIVLDVHEHRSLVAWEKGFALSVNVLGGICFRTFKEQGFIEIVFVAVSQELQTKGIGRSVMNQLKEHMKNEGIYHFLTCADNDAVEFFKKQGFSENVTLPPKIWRGFIKDYSSTKLMQCSIDPRVPNYLEVSSMIRSQIQCLNTIIAQSSSFNLLSNANKSPVSIHTNTPSIPIPSTAHISSNSNQMIAAATTANTNLRINTTTEITTTANSMIDEHIIQKEQLEQELRALLDRIKKSDNAWPFLKPVDLKMIPKYKLVIAKPMDLSTIESKLNKGDYSTKELFFADLHLMLENCKLFNPQGNPYHSAAVGLENELPQD